MVIFPITLIKLEHLSVMAAYVVLYIRLANMVLKTAYAREIPAESKEIDNIVGVLFTIVSWLAAP